MLMTPRDRQGLLEAPDVHLEGRRVEPDGRTVDDETPVAEARPQDRQCAAKGASCTGAVGLGPEERRDGLPARRPSGHGEVREEGHRLSGVDGQRRAADLDRHRAEQADPDGQRPAGGRLGWVRHRTSRYSVQDGFRNERRSRIP